MATSISLLQGQQAAQHLKSFSINKEFASFKNSRANLYSEDKTHNKSHDFNYHSNFNDYAASVYNRENKNSSAAQEAVINHNESLKNYISRMYNPGANAIQTYQAESNKAASNNLNQSNQKSNSQSRYQTNQKIRKLVQMKEYVGEIQQNSPKSQQFNGKIFQIIEFDSILNNGYKYNRPSTNQVTSFNSNTNSINKRMLKTGFSQDRGSTAYNMQNLLFSGQSQTNRQAKRTAPFGTSDNKNRFNNSLNNKIQSQQTLEYADNQSTVFNSPMKSQQTIRQVELKSSDMILDLNIQEIKDNLEKIPGEKDNKIASDAEFDLVDSSFIEIQQKYRRLVSYISNQTGFINGLALDVLWKTQFLKFEQMLQKQEEKHQAKLDELSSKILLNDMEKGSYMGLIDKQRKEIQLGFEDQIKTMALTIRDLREQKYFLEGNLEEIRTEMEQLTKFEKRKNALSEVEETYENIAGFLGKVQNEQKRTVLALRKLEVLMGAERGTLTKKSADIQTEKSYLRGIKIGNRNINKTSPNTLAMLVNLNNEKGDVKVMSEQDADKLCEELFSLFHDLENDQVTFEDQIVKYMINKHKSFKTSIDILSQFMEVWFTMFLNRENTFLIWQRKFKKSLRAQVQREELSLEEEQNTTIVQDALSGFVKNYHFMSKLLIKNQILGFKHCVGTKDMDHILHTLDADEKEKKEIMDNLDNEMLDQINFSLIAIAALNKKAEITLEFQNHDAHKNGYVSSDVFNKTIQNFGMAGEFQQKILRDFYDPTQIDQVNYKIFLEHISSKDIMNAACQVYLRVDLIPLAMFEAYEMMESRRFTKLSENYTQHFAKKTIEKDRNLQDLQSQLIDFNFDDFSSFLDKTIPDLDIDFKFELFLPVCTTPFSEFGSPSIGDSFRSFLSTAVDIFDVSQYNDGIMYNNKLIGENEIVRPVQDANGPETLNLFALRNGLVEVKDKNNKRSFAKKGKKPAAVKAKTIKGNQ
ncbi:UNKNOWN [Stylonychia lemnae]|uniref:EF-hand domain-containing protein n=1 Tax=Stylonychia lemnae TaxID=5949 RepID=A0A078A8E1_STYLE|nr:UNKNOWN [Stylonychia lemnae]|eukprot:CDW77046.1 UNKNOWN [Stylonychia lemnae]